MCEPVPVFGVPADLAVPTGPEELDRLVGHKPLTLRHAMDLERNDPRPAHVVEKVGRVEAPVSVLWGTFLGGVDVCFVGDNGPRGPRPRLRALLQEVATLLSQGWVVAFGFGEYGLKYLRGVAAEEGVDLAHKNLRLGVEGVDLDGLDTVIIDYHGMVHHSLSQAFESDLVVRCIEAGVRVVLGWRQI